MSALLKVIQGTRVGDSIGLPMEDFPPHRISNLRWTTPLQQRFVFDHGMWSDDTEHTLLLIEAVMESEQNVDRFQKVFSKKLCFWLTMLPPGIGIATLHSLLRRITGHSLSKSAVFSAGNGPSMRAAALGVLFANEPSKRLAYNHAQVTVTHSDPKALYAAELVVEIAASFTNELTDISPVLNECSKRSANPEWQRLIAILMESHAKGRPISETLHQLNICLRKGVSGYSYHTVPVAIALGLKHQWHFENTLTELISLGGDTDTTAAIAGALCALHPHSHIPKSWDQRYLEWPLTAERMNRITHQIEQGQSARYYHWAFWPFYLMCNIIQLHCILFHLFRGLITRTK